MDHKEVKMLKNNDYLTKDIVETYDTKKKSKKYTVAIGPNGNQYSGNIEIRMELLGFKSISEAKASGWRFK